MCPVQSSKWKKLQSWSALLKMHQTEDKLHIGYTKRLTVNIISGFRTGCISLAVYMQLLDEFDQGFEHLQELVFVTSHCLG